MKTVFVLLFVLFSTTILTYAGKVEVLPQTIVIAIESKGNFDSILVQGATNQHTDGHITYATCDINTEIQLEAKASQFYHFQEWYGYDTTYPSNVLPPTLSNPYIFTLSSNAIFIQLNDSSWLDTIKLKVIFIDEDFCQIKSNISQQSSVNFAVDILGSSLSIDSSIVPPAIKYDQIWKDNINILEWPWNDVKFGFCGDIHLNYYVHAIQVTYKSEHIWKMVLPFDARLISDGASHRVRLPVSKSGFYTYTADIDQFEWPEWYTDHSIPLFINSVRDISFALDENPEVNSYKGTFQIESIELCHRLPIKNDMFQCDISVEDITNSNSNFSLFPNPTTNQLIINASTKLSNQEQLIVEKPLITNIFGQSMNYYSLRQAQGDTLLTINYSLSIDVSQFPAGIYFLKIGDQVQKFVKE